MKKVLVLLMALACLGRQACAEGEAALPKAVRDLCAAAHPGYAIAAYDGGGDESCGQIALILKRGDDNILCMAEKQQQDPAYALTIDNTNAVYDGDLLPSLLIDSGGDSLWFTYYDQEGGTSVHYGSVKSEGRWGHVSTLAYWPREDGLTGIMAGASAGTLIYEETDEDENENIRDRWMYAPVVVNDEFANSLELARFDINTFDVDPRDDLYPMLGNEAFVRSRMAGDHAPLDIDISAVHMATLFEGEAGERLLRVDDWDGTFYQTAVLLRVAGDAALDTYHAGAGSVLVNTGKMMYAINRVDAGSWVLRGVDAESGVRAIGPDYAAPDGQSVVYRNDGYIYGSSPWSRPKQMDAALASSYEEMAAQMDVSAYALVSNPNPADRLHLRARPDKGSHSYGKFYNRTPVLVLERGDVWTKVQIGCGGAAMTGYMMTSFLAFDEEEKEVVACAFPQQVLLEAHPNGVHMYAEPRHEAVTERMFMQESNDFIVGVSGEDWYVVLRADGAVGYVPRHAFWDGNG